MKVSFKTLILLGLISAGVPMSAAQSQPVPLEERARGAARIVVARIADTAARYERNQFGDELIVTDAQLVVEESLKGPRTDVTLTLEGGTVEGITMRASDLPVVEKGERAVFFLAPGFDGRFEPHLRGKGILKLDQNDRVKGSSLTLAEIRRQAQTAGK